MKLLVLAQYNNDARKLNLEPEQLIDVDDALGAFLLADSPLSFTEQKDSADVDKAVQAEYDKEDAADDAETEGIDAPPADKMVKSPKKKK